MENSSCVFAIISDKSYHKLARKGTDWLFPSWYQIIYFYWIYIYLNIINIRILRISNWIPLSNSIDPSSATFTIYLIIKFSIHNAPFFHSNLSSSSKCQKFLARSTIFININIAFHFQVFTTATYWLTDQLSISACAFQLSAFICISIIYPAKPKRPCHNFMSHF